MVAPSLLSPGWQKSAVVDIVDALRAIVAASQNYIQHQARHSSAVSRPGGSHDSEGISNSNGNRSSQESLGGGGDGGSARGALRSQTSSLGDRSAPVVAGTTLADDLEAFRLAVSCCEALAELALTNQMRAAAVSADAVPAMLAGLQLLTSSGVKVGKHAANAAGVLCCQALAAVCAATDTAATNSASGRPMNGSAAGIDSGGSGGGWVSGGLSLDGLLKWQAVTAVRKDWIMLSQLLTARCRLKPCRMFVFLLPRLGTRGIHAYILYIQEVLGAQCLRC